MLNNNSIGGLFKPIGNKSVLPIIYSTLALVKRLNDTALICFCLNIRVHLDLNVPTSPKKRTV